MPVLAWAFDSADLFVGAGGGGFEFTGLLPTRLFMLYSP